MRRLLPVVLGVAACATLKTSSPSTTPFQGGAALEARIAQLNERGAAVGDGCAQGGSGVLEATASADGKVVVRSVLWKGAPEGEACLLAGAAKVSLGPAAGPPVATLWTFTEKGASPPPPPSATGDLEERIRDAQGRLVPEVEGCQQRFLPPEFPADIEVSFHLLPGGRAAAPNVVRSTAKDGEFEACVRQIVLDKPFPETGYPGAFPLKMRFHVGRIEAQ